MKFIDRFEKAIQLCREKKFPLIQIEGLEKNPYLNPNLFPTPRDWFVDSFDWFFSLKLIRDSTYGPFFRIDGDFFWPQIGNNFDIYSETKCFFGMEPPVNNNDAERLYKMMPSTDKKFIYEFSIEMPKWPPIDDAYIFLGAVKNGEGFQVNPNSSVVEIIRKNILENKVKRFQITFDGKFDYSKPEIYSIDQNL